MEHPLIEAVGRALPAPLRRALLRLRARVRDGYDPLATQAYSQEGEDLILLRLFEGQRGGFYVDVGAHHPKRFSNTYLLYRRGWRGINIEPNPDAVKLFQQVRRRDVTLAVGVAEDAGELTYYEFDEPALNTFDSARASKVQDNPRYRLIESRRIPVRRLDTILREHVPRGTPIDVLTVDVEGMDLEVLRSNDWRLFRPRCVLVESLAESIGGVGDSSVHRFVTQQGYELFAKTLNTLMYLDATGDRPPPS